MLKANVIEVEALGERADGALELPLVCGSLEIRVSIPWLGDACVHHPALPRMLNRLWADVGAHWADGDPSALTAPFHFEAQPGLQPFGLPRFLALRGEREGVAVGWEGGDLVHSSATWRQEGDRLSFAIRLEPLGVRAEHQAPWRPPTLRWVWRPPSKLLAPETFAAVMGTLESRFRRHPDRSLTWATWNDGVFRDIDERRILRTARYLAETFDNVGWIQVDDGWAPEAACVAADDGGLGMSDLSVFYRPESLRSDPRFPGGLGALASRIRDLGFRPMIWLTPAADARSELVRDRPEWFQEPCRLHFMPHLRFLDPSVPEARAFFESTLDLAFDTWMFEGAKLDFWTMGFEQTDAVCRNGGQTPMQWMAWMLDALRRRIPDDGRVVHCIDLPFGGLSRARWCDHFRFYADSEGSCAVPAMVREQANWTAMLTAGYGVQQWWVPNADGLGTFPHIAMSEAHHRRWVAMLTASGTLTELAGWLDIADATAVDRVRTAARWAQPGCSVTCPGFDTLAPELAPPGVWLAEGSLGTVVGVTNWTNAPLEVGLPDGLGPMRDAFSGAAMGLRVTVPPEDGVLYLPC